MSRDSSPSFGMSLRTRLNTAFWNATVTPTKRTYWVYIMTNRSRTLYTGVTGNLARRVLEHRRHLVPGFTSRYRIDRLIHAEPFTDVRDAISREKQIKAWRRSHKLRLIAEANPEWRDLGEEWFGPIEPSAEEVSCRV